MTLSATQRALEEKLEKRLRTFMKTEEENKKCFNCASLGPSYVVLTDGQGAQLNVFVCTPCSGVHRTAQHRVKGVTAAKFSEDEVERICEKGGNRRARETFLCNWDSSYLRRPPQSVPRDVQEWIQQVFITKRFKGEPKKEPSPDHIKVIVLPKEQPAPTPAPAPPAAPAPRPPVQPVTVPPPTDFFNFNSPAAAPAHGGFSDPFSGAPQRSPAHPPSAAGGFFEPFPVAAEPLLRAPSADNWANFDDPGASAAPAASGPFAAPHANGASDAGWADFGAPASQPAPAHAPTHAPAHMPAPAPHPAQNGNELFELFSAPAPAPPASFAPSQAPAPAPAHSANPFDDPPAPAPAPAPVQPQAPGSFAQPFGAPSTSYAPQMPPQMQAPSMPSQVQMQAQMQAQMMQQAAPQQMMRPQMMMPQGYGAQGGFQGYPGFPGGVQQQQMMMQQQMYMQQQMMQQQQQQPLYISMQQQMADRYGAPQQMFGGPHMPYGGPGGGLNAMPTLPGVQAIPPASSFGLTNTEKLNKNLFKDLAPNLNTMNLSSKPLVNAPASMQKPMSAGAALKGPAAMTAQKPQAQAGALPSNFSAGNPFAD